MTGIPKSPSWFYHIFIIFMSPDTLLLDWLSDSGVLSIPWSCVNAHEFTGQSPLDTTARHLASPQSHSRTVPSLEHAFRITPTNNRTCHGAHYLHG